MYKTLTLTFLPVVQLAKRQFAFYRRPLKVASFVDDDDDDDDDDNDDDDDDNNNNNNNNNKTAICKAQ